MENNDSTSTSTSSPNNRKDVFSLKNKETDHMSKSRRKDTFVRELESSAAFHIQPKNATQQYLLDCINDSVLTVAVGPAGTGKTFCTGMKVAQLYLKGGFNHIILSRPNISTGKSLGAFPGTVEEKMAPWLAPITSVLRNGFGVGKYTYMAEKKIIQIQPIETIRGNSFEDSLIIVDEAQNLTMDELKAITTRIGENSKLILMGDPNQNDLKLGCDLTRFIDLCHKHQIEAPIVTFGLKDIVRSDIVAQLCRMFYTEEV